MVPLEDVRAGDVPAFGGRRANDTSVNDVTAPRDGPRDGPRVDGVRTAPAPPRFDRASSAHQTLDRSVKSTGPGEHHSIQEQHHARGSDHRRRPHRRRQAQRCAVRLAPGRPGRRDPHGARRAQQPRPRARRRRDHGLRDAGRRPGTQRRAQRGARRGLARVGPGDHRRPPVRVVPAGVPLRGAGRHGRRLRRRRRRRRRGHEPGAHGRLDLQERRLPVRRRSRALLRRGAARRASRHDRPGHVRRDHRQRVGPQPRGPRRLRGALAVAGGAGRRRGPLRQRDHPRRVARSTTRRPARSRRSARCTPATRASAPAPPPRRSPT